MNVYSVSQRDHALEGIKRAYALYREHNEPRHNTFRRVPPASRSRDSSAGCGVLLLISFTLLGMWMIDSFYN
ncbi:hypothetical protein J2S62_002706 [Enteractinococcus fodinae]|uniref:Integrase catalytic domain-containing protein n=1 Tax=Enteractinococcus fodinae TaxID=684663 RepID=A0ABU2B4A9_9MICC|nr:hypothetical protein [Enteractinococcus fodinae]